MVRKKIYHSFCDKYGKEYKFDDYISFSSFWFGMSRKMAKIYFPENFDKLQRAASESKEARQRVQ